MRELDLTVDEDRADYFEVIEEILEIDRNEIFIVEYIERIEETRYFIYKTEEFAELYQFLQIVQCRCNIYFNS